MNHPSIFVISLDFELHWGGFEKWPLSKDTPAGRKFQKYFLNTRNIIPQMLSEMYLHGVHATWATVGLLFHKNIEELNDYRQEPLPSFKRPNLSAYHYIDTMGIGANEAEDPFHFAHSLIQQISPIPGMEIGSHTYSHFFACEPGQTPEQFRLDLKKAVSLARLQGLSLTSLVLPRNQINSDYLMICADEGFQSLRVNPRDWFWDINEKRHDSLWKGFFRNLDDLFHFGFKKSFPVNSIQKQRGCPVLIPTSRFFRPYSSGFPLLTRLRVDRILSEMRQAAQSGEVYHLWWHPHNFGSHPSESMSGLKRILNHYQKLKSEYGMLSMNMNELTTFAKNCNPDLKF